jgi:osmotically-inducible protein OsmY
MNTRIVHGLIRRDEEIRAEVHALLADRFGYVPQCWTVGVRDGVVSLRGERPSRGDALAVRTCVHRIAGVVSVEDRQTYAADQPQGPNAPQAPRAPRARVDAHRGRSLG